MGLGFMLTAVSFKFVSIDIVLTLIAFGIFARALPNEDDYKTLLKRVEGLELADSITVDGHKLLNVVSVSCIQTPEPSARF